MRESTTKSAVRLLGKSTTKSAVRLLGELTTKSAVRLLVRPPVETNSHNVQ
jgi:hypothetical protein